MSNVFVYEGKVHHISEPQSYGSNGFVKQDLVCYDTREWKDKKYTDYAKFVVKNAVCDQLKGLQTNGKVKVSFRIEARSWQPDAGPVKWFSDAVAFRIEGDAAQQVELIKEETAAEADQEEIPF